MLTVLLRWPLLEGSGVLSRWHCIHLISCCLLPIAYFSAASYGARGRIIHRELGIETRYRIIFIICISRTVGHYTQCFVCELLFLVFAVYKASPADRSLLHIIDCATV